MYTFVIDREQELVIASGLSIDTKKEKKKTRIEGSVSVMKILNTRYCICESQSLAIWKEVTRARIENCYEG